LTALQPMGIVPRLYDVVELEQTAYLVVEYLGDQSLADMQSAAYATGISVPHFPFERAVEWGKALCDLLHFMHTQSPPLLARELCDENIYLSPDRSTLRMLPSVPPPARLAKLSLRELRRRQQGIGLRMGCYMVWHAAPEQMIGKPEPRSDLFSL